MDYKKIYEACLREDSLDDWDIDGSIERANNEAKKDEKLQIAINRLTNWAKEQVFDMIEDEVINKYGLSRVYDRYDLDVGKYRFYTDYPWCGGNRVGGAVYFYCTIGDDYYGVTEEQKALKGTNEWLPAVKSMMAEITENLTKRLCQCPILADCIDGFPPLRNGSHVSLRQGRFDKYCIEIWIPIQITQEIVDHFSE